MDEKSSSTLMPAIFLPFCQSYKGNKEAYSANWSHIYEKYSLPSRI